MVLAAAEAGIHVLVEKPMATSLEDCLLMMESCSRAGVTMTVGHIQHFLPEKAAAEQFLRSEALGKLLMIRDFRSTDYRPGTRPDWFFDPSVAGGGALMNIGGHCIDRSLWFGDSPVDTVDARTHNRFGVAVETDGYVVLQLRNGVEVNIVIVSDPPHRADEVLLICEQGSISCTPDRGTVVRQNGTSTTIFEPSAQGIQQGFTAQLSDFIGTLHGAEPKVSNSHARSVVETILAAYRSAATRGVVSLSEPAALTDLEHALSTCPVTNN
jgi:predicted dehydrogenase